MKCCYCKKTIKGKAEYCIPEGFPTNPVHDGKPLCNACGGFPYPTLDEICETLDMELELLKPSPIGPGGGLRVGGDVVNDDRCPKCSPRAPR